MSRKTSEGATLGASASFLSAERATVAASTADCRPVGLADTGDTTVERMEVTGACAYAVPLTQKQTALASKLAL